MLIRTHTQEYIVGTVKSTRCPHCNKALTGKRWELGILQEEKFDSLLVIGECRKCNIQQTVSVAI